MKLFDRLLGKKEDKTLVVQRAKEQERIQYHNAVENSKQKEIELQNKSNALV